MLLVKERPQQQSFEAPKVKTGDEAILERINQLPNMPITNQQPSPQQIEVKPIENATIEQPDNYDAIKRVLAKDTILNNAIIEDYIPTPVLSLYPKIGTATTTTNQLAVSIHNTTINYNSNILMTNDLPLFDVVDYVPRSQGPIVVTSSPAKAEYTSNYASWLFNNKPKYQGALDILNNSLSTSDKLTGNDKSLIVGYPRTVRQSLSEGASIESRIDLFEDAIKSALWYYKGDKTAYEKALRSSFYEVLILEEITKVRGILQPARKEENFDLLLNPFLQNLEKIKELSGKQANNPLKDLYSNAFKLNDLYEPMKQLLNAYLSEFPMESLSDSTSPKDTMIRPILKHRWQQFAQIYEVLYASEPSSAEWALKPGFASGEPMSLNGAFIKTKAALYNEKIESATADFFEVSDNDVVAIESSHVPSPYKKDYIEVHFQSEGIRPEDIATQRLFFGMRYRLTTLTASDNPWAVAFYKHQKKLNPSYEPFSQALQMEQGTVARFLSSNEDQELLDAVHRVVQAVQAGSPPVELQETIAHVPSRLFDDTIFFNYLTKQAQAEKVEITKLLGNPLNSPIIAQAMMAWFDNSLSGFALKERMMTVSALPSTKNLKHQKKKKTLVSGKI